MTGIGAATSLLFARNKATIMIYTLLRDFDSYRQNNLEVYNPPEALEMR
jgi:hypothetical protein